MLAQFSRSREKFGCLIAPSHPPVNDTQIDADFNGVGFFFLGAQEELFGVTEPADFKICLGQIDQDGDIVAIYLACILEHLGGFHQPAAVPVCGA